MSRELVRVSAFNAYEEINGREGGRINRWEGGRE
jgi:hypothetical protein